jgi:hypothetical protein
MWPIGGVSHSGACANRGGQKHRPTRMMIIRYDKRQLQQNLGRSFFSAMKRCKGEAQWTVRDSMNSREHWSAADRDAHSCGPHSALLLV